MLLGEVGEVLEPVLPRAGQPVDEDDRQTVARTDVHVVDPLPLDLGPVKMLAPVDLAPVRVGRGAVFGVRARSGAGQRGTCFRGQDRLRHDPYGTRVARIALDVDSTLHDY